MTRPRYAMLAARLLGRQREDIRRVIAHSRRLATVDRALAARRRRRSLYAALSATTLVAAGVALWIAVNAFRAARTTKAAPQTSTERVALRASPLGAGAIVLTADGETELTSGLDILTGGRVSTRADGGANLELSTGTRLRLGAGASLSIQSDSAMQRFSFASGVLHARVKKLEQGQRFIIDTPDVQVEVRGTAFQLKVMEPGRFCSGYRTRVEVSEGVVEVRSQGGVARVTRGQNWPASCDADPALASRPPAVGSTKTIPRLANKAATGPVDPEPSPGADNPIFEASSTEESSLLKRQSDLFAAAVGAHKRGDVRRALTLYQQLIDQYPASALSENALAARMRLFISADPKAASREARRYLSRYPNGFARTEAKRLIRSR